MKNIIILSLILTGLVQADEYRISHIKRGGALNVRDIPFKNESKVVGKIASYVTGITVKECTELENGSEWCYVKAPKGASHIEGWVNSYFLKKMKKTSNTSKAHIQNFLHNFYMAEAENYMDKLQVFYAFPMQKYLWNRNVSLIGLRTEKVREYKMWPERNLRLTYLKILKRKSNYIDVQTTVRWNFKNGDEFENGKDIEKLRLVLVDNTFKVSALKKLTHIVFPKPLQGIDENLTQLVDEDNNTMTPSVKFAGKNQFYIKSGSFFSNISDSYLTNITNNGFPYIIRKVKQGDKIIKRVYIGPFNSFRKAREALAPIRENINKFAYIQSNIR